MLMTSFAFGKLGLSSQDPCYCAESEGRSRENAVLLVREMDQEQKVIWFQQETQQVT